MAAPSVAQHAEAGRAVSPQKASIQFSGGDLRLLGLAAFKEGSDCARTVLIQWLQKYLHCRETVNNWISLKIIFPTD
jgi:hypothetical protein